MAKTDFDFFHGTWTVHNRRLTASGEWEEFPATCAVRPLAAGIGFIDEMIFPTLGSAGHTIGLYDSTKDVWAHYWVGSRDGLLQPAVYGGVEGLYGDGDRQLWRLESPGRLLWEQASTSDGGQTWVTNWVMTSTRIG